ncbi:glutathione S-transferase family protein [Roseibium polysiphoniae]|uniref:Glutathione S-transferase family protein n=1 Tax=Roseibium polysiphoniae TaxID=2571221 RepID=A0A944GR61_9HYPH|nr:glutathione S-transferase family protein [Roseibium polysiphoniae]MBS8258894.1 glutathione S-transferase family protein [Roseibium polysiphoniae]
MPELELFIGNKNYSSWSFRPWLALRQNDIPFRETLVPFEFDNGNPAFKTFSPTVKVPVLKDGDLTVWESLAIIEYIAEIYPNSGLLPADRSARARVRAASAEMHSSFSAMRSAFPMNFHRPAGALAISASVQKDIDRVVALWNDCLETSGGPFLFGSFTMADAMYAPVVSRFATYEATNDPVATAYMEKMRALPVWKEWEKAALDETWIIEAEEV